MHTGLMFLAILAFISVAELVREAIFEKSRRRGKDPQKTEGASRKKPLLPVIMVWALGVAAVLAVGYFMAQTGTREAQAEELKAKCNFVLSSIWKMNAIAEDIRTRRDVDDGFQVVRAEISYLYGTDSIRTYSKLLLKARSDGTTKATKYVMAALDDATPENRSTRYSDVTVLAVSEDGARTAIAFDVIGGHGAIGDGRRTGMDSVIVSFAHPITAMVEIGSMTTRLRDSRAVRTVFWDAGRYGGPVDDFSARLICEEPVRFQLMPEYDQKSNQFNLPEMTLSDAEGDIFIRNSDGRALSGIRSTPLERLVADRKQSYLYEAKQVKLDKPFLVLFEFSGASRGIARKL